MDELPLVSRHLTRIQLHSTTLNDSFLDFSSCPALEHLVFDFCILECAKISSGSVKLLSITDSNFSETLRVRIDMPSHVSLWPDDLFYFQKGFEMLPNIYTGLEHISKIKGIFNPMERSAGLLEHLQIVEVHCEVVDDEVLKVEPEPEERPKVGDAAAAQGEAAEEEAVFPQAWTDGDESCPEGTVPVRRMAKRDVLRSSSSLRFGMKQPRAPPASSAATPPTTATRSWHPCCGSLLLRLRLLQLRSVETLPAARIGVSGDARGLFDEMSTGKEGNETTLATDADHIGALPDTVIHHILSFLPSQDAVRTCMLAKRWLHLWRSVTALRIGDRDKRKLWTVKGLQGFVEHFLLLRDSVPLHTCVLRFIVFSEDHSETSRLNLWIKHALLRMVQFLQVSIRQNTAFYHQIYLDILPFVSQHLSMLELHGVRMVGSFLDFSRCPALQHLEFDRCELPCDKISSESVKLLRITRCKFSQTSRVRICIPSLVSLRLDDFYRRTPVLERMPSLVEAFVRVVHRTYDCCGYDYSNSGNCGNEHCKSCHGIKDNNNCVLLDGLSEAKTLALIDETISFIFNRDLKWCPTFNKLKTLLLNEYWCVPDEFSALACILEHTPVLENLILQLYSEGPKHTMKINGNCHPMDRSAAISGQLEIVEIRCEVVDKRVLKVLKYLSTFDILFSFEQVKISEEDDSDDNDQDDEEDDDDDFYGEEEEEEEEEEDDEDEDD
uniref:F-box domain-containing protein n=1 Tax=Oryza punctata TaxID=4537 RepID=A0A0E0MDL4_ORYPU